MSSNPNARLRRTMPSFEVPLTPEQQHLHRVVTYELDRIEGPGFREYRNILTYNFDKIKLIIKIYSVVEKSPSFWMTHEKVLAFTSGFFTPPESLNVHLSAPIILKVEKNIWFNGVGGFVNVVMIVKWSRRFRQINGSLDVWRKGERNPTSMPIFPAPPRGSPPQTVTIYRKDFYPEGEVPAGRNPNDTLLWDLDVLRAFARTAIELEGYHPE
ncbi:hypothetical protein BO94DRAFT_545597 [Aspergillus sclerotioniger CBS 115572]|uniref:Uncharacterized protein n=1 Tax=Aspergillus sclerotioniger CBS 115572 TaxID=1450535 RepID=A0A317WWD0_9EURO|nr:hypothetical protein BO94DRAFT_545597 [Aspergillus sclerotioniger CBS 115572]PWY89622.1 hypothetical protein BO94DRAFT_545597 [Aspergillus sclerotioniger CBS 115572]